MRARRLLICNYEYPPLGGGGGTCSRFLGIALAKAGHDVELVTAAYRDLPAREADQGLRIVRVPALRKQEGQSNPIEMMSFVASAAPRLLLRRRLPDAVISFHSIPSGLAAFPMSLLRGVPHIVLFRGGDVPGWLPGELEKMHALTLWLNRLIVYRAASALANSNGLRDLAQLAFPKKNIGVLPNGVDAERFRPPAEGRAGRTGPVRLFFAGRITTQKGVDTLLRALAEGAVRDLDWRMVIGGTGPQLGAYKELAGALGIAAKVEFVGWLSRERILAEYAAADALVFPSRYEGMPNVVLEAMACGLPIVGTRIAGTEELVREGENGFLVAPDDAVGLSRAIAEVVENAARRAEMGVRSRAIIEGGWSWEKRAEELGAEVERVARG